jgi:hypothetical protein
LEIVDTVGQLNYRYDDDPFMLHWRFPPIALAFTQVRPAAATAVQVPAGGQLRVLAESTQDASGNRIELGGKTLRVLVPLTDAAAGRIRTLITNNVPRQVFLRFDNINYDKSNGVAYEVYANPPAGEKLNMHTPGYVGNLALFGLKPHAMAGHPPPPARDIFIDYDISQLVRGALAGNPKTLTVVLVPRGLSGANGEPLPVPEETQATVSSVRIMSR